MDWFDRAVLVAFAGLSVWILAVIVGQAIGHGRVWTGTDGVAPQDQMQYVAWIRDSSRHLLASNLFVLTPTPHDYLQPLVAISGLVTVLGVVPWLTLLLWKPVAVGATFFAVRAYVHRVVAGVSMRRAALVLALFFVGPGQFIAHAFRVLDLRLAFQWLDVTNGPWIGWWSWGYPFGLIALAATLGAVLAYDRERKHQRTVGFAALLGAVASWLHPWQGATLIMILGACEIVEFARTRERPRTLHVLVVSFATILPLLYYAVLARADLSWKLSEAASRGSWPLWALVLCELPLAVPAAFAYAVRPVTFVDRATRAWPIAALATFLLLEKTGGGFALHAFLGINVPLAILAVQGWAAVTARLTWLRRPVLAWIAVGILTLPALGDQLRWAHGRVLTDAQAPPPRGYGNAQFVDRGESRALDYLARAPERGGVLTRSYLGTVVPAESGRPTYVGDTYWSPDYLQRATTADNLFLGRMPAGTARLFVRHTEARFMLVDCTSRQDLNIALAPLVATVHRFGCASVYVLR